MADDFKPVMIPEEREEVFHALLTHTPPIMGLAQDNTVFHFQFLKIERSAVFVKQQVTAKRPLLASEILTLVFTLPTGQYLARGKMALRDQGVYALSSSCELFRLQRRSAFRAPIPLAYPVSFLCTELAGTSCKQTFPVIDISAGGVALRIPTKLQPSDTIKGSLIFPDEDTLEVRGEIRHVESPSSTAGIQFLETSAFQQQLLFTITLKIYRITSSNLLP